MAKKHSDRLHAQWSASSTERNWLCPGNIALVLDLPRQPESKAAAWGTAAHEVAEINLKGGDILAGSTIETERYTHTVDQEMLDTVAVYTDYISLRQEAGYDIYAIESKFDLAQFDLGMEAGGTADCILYNPTTEDLEVVDLKTGKGHVVEATGNPQARFYAVGAIAGMDFDPTPVKTVTTTIVQPRAHHRDGIIRSETIGLMDLLDWTIDLSRQVRTAAAALAMYTQARGSAVKVDAWADTYLFPGEVQCHFCPAAGACPALRRASLAIAGAWEDDSGVHLKSNQFEQNSVEGVEADLDMLDTLEEWIRERRALAHAMAVGGAQFDHHVLVEKVGHRKFTLEGNDLVTAINNRLPMPLADAAFYDLKMKSPAGLERLIGREGVAEFLGDIIERPVTGTDLIRSSQTGRQTVPSVDSFFIEPVEGDSYGTGK